MITLVAVMTIILLMLHVLCTVEKYTFPFKDFKVEIFNCCYHVIFVYLSTDIQYYNNSQVIIYIIPDYAQAV